MADEIRQRSLYVFVPRNIVPIQTDAECGKRLRQTRENEGSLVAALDNKLRLPATRGYCEDNGIPINPFNSNSGLIRDMGVLFGLYDAVVCVCGIMPPEGEIEAVVRKFSAKYAGAELF